MTTATITQRGTIRAGHPVRGAFSNCSTGNAGGMYYDTKGHAICTFDAELKAFDLCLDPDDLADFYGNAGRKMIAIYAAYGDCVGYAVLMWYRMPSGRYEFIGYLA